MQFGLIVFHDQQVAVQLKVSRVGRDDFKGECLIGIGVGWNELTNDRHLPRFQS